LWSPAAQEGAHRIVGYRAQRERAEALRAAIESSFGCTVSLIAGDTLPPQFAKPFLPPRRDFPRRSRAWLSFRATPRVSPSRI